MRSFMLFLMILVLVSIQGALDRVCTALEHIAHINQH